MTFPVPPNENSAEKGEALRVLVTGSRTWDDVGTIRNALLSAQGTRPAAGMTLVSGACPTGADRLAEFVATSLRWKVERHPAEWQRFGKSAGFVRNKTMVDLGADLCLAFIRNGSPGASMTARLAEDSAIPTKRFEAAS